MKNLFLAGVSLAFVVSCTSTQTQQPTEKNEIYPFANGTQITSLSLKDMVETNFKLDRAYHRVAQEADSANHMSNAVLLSTALSIALGSFGSASSSAIDRQVTTMLAFNEGIKYANPPQIARAYRKAAREALCLARTTVSQGTKKEPKEMTDPQLLGGSMASRVKLASVMRHSYNNLRVRLSRERIGFTTLLDGLRKREEILQKEDNIDRENKLAEAEAKNKDDQFSARLLSCLE